MIQIEQHPNLAKWQSILDCGNLINQVQGKANALRIASKIAKRQGKTFVVDDGKVVSLFPFCEKSHSEQLGQ